MHNRNKITRVTNKKLEKGIERDQLRQTVEEEQQQIEDIKRARKKPKKERKHIAATK